MSQNNDSAKIVLDDLHEWFKKNKCNGCPYGANLLDKIKSLYPRSSRFDFLNPIIFLLISFGLGVAFGVMIP